ncbi:unnamed protein product [Chilo suppressalis]|uniref:microsomal epoxide hydrolase n=1 Tax=Chilo suppressalis TaxID=168631 RepID=A0ABN8EB56_CHISP|nr:unnamed protein product [Chilo suppressalis]
MFYQSSGGIRPGHTCHRERRTVKMIKLLILLLIGVVAFLPIYLLYLKSPPPLPEVDLNEWWGHGEPKEDTAIKPYKIKFTESVIKDLKDRLKSRRPFTPPLEGVAFEYGFNTNTLDSWATYWLEKYNFTERENFLNQYPHYKTNIQGLNIHFIRVTPKVPAGKQLVPMLLLHGWPGSVREFYEAIPYLTAASEDRDFVLELIIPSLPGYGFSDPAVRPGMDTLAMAVIFRNLMQRLGFQKYYIQGGDWGSYITSNMATLFPKEVIGYHANLVLLVSPTITFFELLGSIYPPLVVDSKQANRMYPPSEKFSFLLEETGYFHIQATKPDTVGVALLDSPSGLMAYILEKFSTVTNRLFRSRLDGGLEDRFTKDQLIDNLMMYWTTRSMTSAMRLYAESSTKRHYALKLHEIPTQVPMCTIQTKNEIVYLPPWLIKLKYPNHLRDNPLDEGGHFLALELPQVFSEDILDAVKTIRQWYKNKNVKTDL